MSALGHAPNRTMSKERFRYMEIGTPNTELGNAANPRIRCRAAALWERRMGQLRRRLALPRQRRVGLALAIGRR
jgi:hypothetical protein